ncbi:MAG TPA: C40 family peptidase [Gaiellales bacterium]|nr:C40 family peptidase [Gaiellales bacterium]
MLARGQARRWAARATRASSIPLLLALLATTALTVSPASAASVRSLRAQAAAAEQRLAELNAVSEQKIQAFDLVDGRYRHTLASLRVNRQLLASASANLAITRGRLAQSLRRSYKSGEQSPLTYLLAAQSISNLVDQVQLMQRENSSNTALMQQVRRYQALVERSRRALERERKVLQGQLRAAARARASALASAAAARNYLAGLNSKLRAAIAAQQAAAERAAAAAAAAAAQQAAAGQQGGPGPVVPGNGTLGQQAVAVATQYLGVPYVYGGASPAGFDCSGLTMYVYAQLGVSLPHNAAAQYAMLPHISESQLQPGDLVFFFGLGHVAMYVGNGTVIQAPHTGTDVSYASLASMQYGYVGAARVP